MSCVVSNIFRCKCHMRWSKLMRRIVVAMLKDVDAYDTTELMGSEYKTVTKLNPQKTPMTFDTESIARYAAPECVTAQWNRILGGTDSLRRSLNTLAENGFIEKGYSGWNSTKTGRITCWLTEKGREKALEFREEALKYIKLWSPIVNNVCHRRFNPNST